MSSRSDDAADRPLMQVLSGVHICQGFKLDNAIDLRGEGIRSGDFESAAANEREKMNFAAGFDFGQ